MRVHTKIQSARHCHFRLPIQVCFSCFTVLDKNIERFNEGFKISAHVKNKNKIKLDKRLMEQVYSGLYNSYFNFQNFMDKVQKHKVVSNKRCEFFMIFSDSTSNQMRPNFKSFILDKLSKCSNLSNSIRNKNTDTNDTEIPILKPMK